MSAELLPLTPPNFPPGSWVLGKSKIHRVESWPSREAVQVESWFTTDPSAIDPEHPDQAKYNVEATGSFIKIADAKIGKPAEEPEPIAAHTPNPRDQVMGVLQDGPPLVISDIARATGLAEAVVTAFVETLVAEGLVQAHDAGNGIVAYRDFTPEQLSQPPIESAPVVNAFDDAPSASPLAAGGIVVEGTVERLDEAVVKSRLAADHERFALTGSSLPLPDIRVCSEGDDEKQAYDLIRHAQDILLLASYAIRDRHLRRDCLDAALTAGYLIDSEVSA